MKTGLQSKTAEWLEYIGRFNRHPWPLDIKKAALIVIDMQEYFVGKGEEMILFKEEIIQNIKSLTAHFRKCGRPVIFTSFVQRPDGKELGILGRWWKELPVEGAPEAEIIEDLRPQKGEMVILKNRYSSFFETGLEEYLLKNGIETLVVAGVMTNICCESTARDAFFRDIHVKFVADATGTVKEDMHKGTLLNLAYAFADVMTTDSIISEGR